MRSVNGQKRRSFFSMWFFAETQKIAAETPQQATRKKKPARLF